MRLPITSKVDSASASANTTGPFVIHDNETFLLELQGSLETDADTPVDAYGQLIGQLDMSNPVKPALMIGHHRLVGRIDSLPKPLAVLRHTFAGTLSPTTTDDDDEPSPAKRSRTELLQTSSPDTFRKHQTHTPSRIAELKTPAKVSSSPLPPGPATPTSVVDLTRGQHEIIALIKRKIIFSKRPEPISIVKPEVEAS